MTLEDAICVALTTDHSREAHLIELSTRTGRLKVYARACEIILTHACEVMAREIIQNERSNGVEH